MGDCDSSGLTGASPIYQYVVPDHEIRAKALTS